MRTNPESDTKKRRTAAEILRAFILYAAFVLIILLAVPICPFLAAIIGIWKGADRLIRLTERN